MQTPILFLIFNRPETTALVFEKIKQAAPKRLYIAADGPRPGKEEEDRLCRQSREIATGIDWNCEVKTLFREKNLGCKTAVSSAINWFFEQEEEGIILEDDCLPNESFFPFCEAMLEKYRDDKRIMHISGDNFQHGAKRGNASYYFSKYSHVWGWASWKRAWKHYDPGMKSYPAMRTTARFRSFFHNRTEWIFWRNIFDKVYDGSINTWDYQWTYAIWMNNGFVVLPGVNLVSNIGFGIEATHTSTHSNQVASLPTYPLNEIIEPAEMIPDSIADKYTFEHIFCPELKTRIKLNILAGAKTLFE